MYGNPMNQTRNFRTLGAGDKESGVAKQIGEFETVFLKWLVDFHNATRRDVLSLDEIQSLLQLLKHMEAEDKEEYLETLIKPEVTRGCKIPSTIPAPTSAFQLHNSITFAPNSSGHAAIVFNPFFLTSNTAVPGFSTLYINNNNNLTGSANSNFFTGRNIGQTIPPVYNQYRLVSASIIIRYIGRLDIVQGVIGGAIVFDNNVTPIATDGSVNVNLQKFGNFNLAQDSYYYQENLTLAGIREIYFPLDPTFEEYHDMGIGLNDAKTGFSFVLYLQDGVQQGSLQNYKIDIYCNFECLADPEFLNYIPTNLGKNQTPSEKGDAVRIAQQQAITPGRVPEKSKESKPSIWSRMASSIGSVLPSIGQITNLLSGVIPGAKIVGPLLNSLGSSFTGTVGGGQSAAPSFINPNGMPLDNGAVFNDSIVSKAFP